MTPVSAVTLRGIIVGAYIKNDDMKDDDKRKGPDEANSQESKPVKNERRLTDDGRESSNGKVTGVEGKDYVILSSGLGIDESEVTG
jgi:hypothetical protein